MENACVGSSRWVRGGSEMYSYVEPIRIVGRRGMWWVVKVFCGSTGYMESVWCLGYRVSGESSRYVICGGSVRCRVGP